MTWCSSHPFHLFHCTERTLVLLPQAFIAIALIIAEQVFRGTRSLRNPTRQQQWWMESCTAAGTSVDPLLNEQACGERACVEENANAVLWGLLFNHCTCMWSRECDGHLA